MNRTKVTNVVKLFILGVFITLASGYFYKSKLGMGVGLLVLSLAFFKYNRLYMTTYKERIKAKG